MATTDFARGTGLRFHQVTADGMEPTIRRLDYVLVAPAHGYVGDGLYLIGDPIDDEAVVFDCSGAHRDGKPMVRLRSHNTHYPDQFIPRAVFEEHVLAEVVMTCNVIRPDVLSRIASSEDGGLTDGKRPRVRLSHRHPARRRSVVHASIQTGFRAIHAVRAVMLHYGA